MLHYYKWCVYYGDTLIQRKDYEKENIDTVLC